MKYYEVTFSLTPCSQDAQDILSAMAAEAGFETFEETEGGLTGYVQQQLFDQQTLDAVIEDFPFADTHITYNVREAEDRDWNEQWEQEGFEPIVVRGEKEAGKYQTLVIHDGRHLPEELSPHLSPLTSHPSPLTTHLSPLTPHLFIEIDAHMAFGTGTHETTRMICSTLLDMNLEGKRMLDCGCGTGILGICGLKLGAQSCTAYDIDEWSVDNTRHNSIINRVDDNMTVLHGDASLLSPDSRLLSPDSRFDVVVANINRNILLQDMERFTSVMAPHATLVLSGFYQDDCDQLIDKAQELGLKPVETRHDGAWACIKAMLLSLLLLIVGYTQAGNRIYVPNVRSLTSIVNDDWLNRPVMELGSADRLRIGFDELSHNFHRFVYRLEHCETDWTVSDGLFESDWLEGFNGIPIEDYQNSINTTVLYTHYQLTIPNDQCRLKMSGNYRLTVYDEDNSDERILEVEFYVVEPLMSIGMEVTTNTDVDHNRSHQQLSMSVLYNDVRVTNVDDQLHTVVMQNWREDNARHDIRPTYINMRGLGWEHQRELIFDAGNEYHKYEVLDTSHPTMGIDHIDWDGEHYQVWPFPSTVRRNYLTDVDADGAFRIRNSEMSEIDYTCDYVWVNYVLQSPWQGDLYIDAHWTTDYDREHYKMRYEGEKGVYYTQLMQKQGYYSYQYLTADGHIPPSEGSFYQTENRYQALVYYKGIGERTWRLVGYRGVEFR